MVLWRFLVAVIVTIAIHMVLFAMSYFILPEDLMELQNEIQGDTLRIWGTIGHILQSTLFVLIYFLLVKSVKVRVGIVYGLLMMLYLTAIDFTVLAGFQETSAAFTFYLIPFNLLVGVFCGWVLSLLYRPKDSTERTLA